ncbi:MAG: peptidyl-tRNA hydrolase Pth2 [Candidatus Hydrothermarchaeota archaeon]
MEVKQVILIRRDLEISKGKLCVQVAHGSVGAALVSQKRFPSYFKKWIDGGQKKVVLTCKDLDEILSIKKISDEKFLPNYLVRDAGLTELPPGTVTSLAIGPFSSKKIDSITGSLPLLK